jgi:glycerol kinase
MLSVFLSAGLSQSNLLLQIQSDLLGIPILRPAVLETTSLGAAFLGKFRNSTPGASPMYNS